MIARVLIIEDDLDVGPALKRMLEAEDYEVELITNAAQALACAKETHFDVVVTDLQLPPNLSAGLKLITELHRTMPTLPVILMTAHHSADTTIEASKLGAYDYISKGDDLPKELLDKLQKAVKDSRPPTPPDEMSTDEDPPRGTLVGNSRQMQEVFKEIGRMAARPVTVLIQGETGTGKELVARLLHQYSERSARPYIVVNCVAIPETLLEGELFGHEKGAFTGADLPRPGRFEQADHGTIFLDEIGDMTLTTQAKLLRVLQEKTIQRLGGKGTLSIDVRVIAATHRDLEAAILAGKFRQDLYYRLNMAIIKIPALRERRVDIPELVRYFLQRHGPELGQPHPSITSEAIENLEQRNWPGNVRELENAVRKALLLARGLPINLRCVEEALAKTTAMPELPNLSFASYVSQVLARAVCEELEDAAAVIISEAEREVYRQAIGLAKGNQSKAAKWLGVTRATMHEKLRRYGLHSNSGCDSPPAPPA